MASSYTLYDTRPRILAPSAMEENGKFLNNGDILLTLAALGGSPSQTILIPPGHVFDVVLPTMHGLFDDLTPGSELMDDFLPEWERFQQKSADEAEYRRYGTWVYFPLDNHLVHYPPPAFYRLALVVRNSILLQNPAMDMEWEEVRKRGEETIVALAGCSVGNNILTSTVMALRPQSVKVADVKEYQVNNANRVRLRYRDFMRNKAVVTAEQLHASDPFLSISVYTEGVHIDNVDDFVAGNRAQDEPGATVVIEETDDPDIKLLIREKARAHRIPVVMVTDIGSAAQVDVRRFDLDPTLTLTYNASDEELYRKRDIWQADISDREKFFEFTLAMSGEGQQMVPEFKRIIYRDVPVRFAGVPQLGTTAAMAGGLAGDVIAKIVLGHQVPQRIFFDYSRQKLLWYE